MGVRTLMATLEMFVAKGIAEQVHGHKQDLSGKPYLNHIYAVTRAVSHLGDEYIITGFLPDSIEDAKDELRPQIEEQIKATFDEKSVEAVYALTHNDKEDYCDYIARVMQNPIATQVKIADATHNLSRINEITDTEKKERLRKKYKKALTLLGEQNDQSSTTN